MQVPCLASPQVCTLINNIEVAMQKLDELYVDLDVEAKDSNALAVAPDIRLGWLFCLKILRADGLHQQAKRSRASVAISDETGASLITTRQALADETARCEFAAFRCADCLTPSHRGRGD